MHWHLLILHSSQFYEITPELTSVPLGSHSLQRYFFLSSPPGNSCNYIDQGNLEIKESTDQPLHEQTCSLTKTAEGHLSPLGSGNCVHVAQKGWGLHRTEKRTLDMENSTCKLKAQHSHPPTAGSKW